MPQGTLVPVKRNDALNIERLIKDILKEFGFCEVYNYSFVSENGSVAIENPISVESKYLRPSLIPNLSKDIKENAKFFDKIKIFELGKIFKKVSNTEIIEEKKLAGAVIGSSFYEIKGIIDLMLNKFGISDIEYIEDSEVKGAKIKASKKEIGVLREIFLDGNDQQAVIFDIDFEKMQKLFSEEFEYQPICPFPAMIRDISLIVPKSVKVVEILNKINIAGGNLIKDIDLFDIYEKISDTKKSLAFHIIYQATDRTLLSKEVDKIQQEIIKILEKDSEWNVRK